MGKARTLGYGEGSVYPETVRRKTGAPVEVWRGEITIDGKRRRVTGPKRPDALKKLDKLRATAAAGLPMGDDTRLGQYLDWYTERILAHKDPNTAANYSWAFRKLEPLRGKRLRELTPQDVEVLFDLLVNTKPPDGAQKHRGGRQKPLGRSSLLRIRSCLAAAPKKAQARDLIARNVALLVELPSDAAKPVDKRALTQEEAKRLLDHVAGSRWEAMVLTAMSLGLRPQEVLGLPWKAIDFDQCTIEIMQALKRLPGGQLVIGPPKSGSYRTVRLPSQIVEALGVHRVSQKKERLRSSVWADHGLVFPSALGTPMDFSNLRRVVQTQCREAGVPVISPNEFRHSAATLLSEVGIPIHAVADMLGHKDTRMLAKHYRHQRGVVDLTDGQSRMFGS